MKQIASARVKTDIRDTLILARLLAANLVPDVDVDQAAAVMMKVAEALKR